MAIYCRISDDPDRASTSTKIQERDCRALADRHGWLVTEVYVDRDLSAFTGKVHRPAFERLLADLDAGACQGVICWKLDRLARNHADFGRLHAALERADATLVSVHEQFDSATPAGEFVVSMLIRMARMESHGIALRVRAKMADKARAGELHRSGRRPFGYQADQLHIDEAEAAIVRELADRVLRGETLRSLAADLNKRGVKTTGGNAWYPHNLRRMLTSPRLAAIRAHRGVRVAEGKWPPILDVQTHELLVTLLKRQGRGRPPTRLLTGLLVCDVCDSRLSSHPQPRGDRYVCRTGPGLPGCGKVAVLADPADEAITELVLDALAGPDLVRALQHTGDADVAAILAQLETDEQALEEAAFARFTERTLDHRAFLKVRERLQARIASGRRQLDRLAGASALAGVPSAADDLRAAWEGWPTERRRAILQAVLTEVRVRPTGSTGGRFDPTRRLDPHWRV
jgi:DNA invertase Pin-like site-specific DNA recombinase